MWKWKAPRIAKTTLKIKSIVTKLISRLTNIQESRHTVLVSTQTNQWNRIESPKIDTQVYGQLVFDKTSVLMGNLLMGGGGLYSGKTNTPIM